ncbi:MAG TPA: hypothetical protein VD886_07735 [Herpetosiphonaceae bacterium]|nr:hypothetical protein [Herpetosiphonaceae bacterium]
MFTAECHVRHEDSYLVVVLDPELDRRWGFPEHVAWANPGADLGADQPIGLRPSDEHTSLRVQRSNLEALVIVTPHAPLYAYLNARGVPATYHGQLDDAGRLELTARPGSGGENRPPAA